MKAKAKASPVDYKRVAKVAFGAFLGSKSLAPRVTKVSIGRLFNLGNFEHIRYEVELEIPPGFHARAYCEILESILEDLRPLKDDQEAMDSHQLAGLKALENLTDWEKTTMKQVEQRMKESKISRRKRVYALKKLDHLGSRVSVSQSKRKEREAENYE